MKYFFTVLFFISLHFHLSAQQFSQYNTGTLYDSFENPSQSAFVPDYSRNIAFNFLLPNFNTDLVISGDAQPVIKRRIFSNNYGNAASILQPGKHSYLNLNSNIYAIMFKISTGADGSELGFSLQTRVEGRGAVSDETLMLISDFDKFKANPVDGALNPRYSYQAYHQISFSYRKNLTDELAIGIKLSALSGIAYNKVNINNANVTFDDPNNSAYLSMAGNYYTSFEPGKFNNSNMLPVFKNPGAGISLGAGYADDNGLKLQWNIKDLGFISWSKKSYAGTFNNTGVISSSGYEDSITQAAVSIMKSGTTQRSFTTPTDGLAEFSVSKTIALERYGYSSYTPVLILSKELFYKGFTTALVNHFQYHHVIASLTGSYDDTGIFNWGGQLMFKAPNAEFFIGSDRVWQSLSLIRGTILNSAGQLSKKGEFSGGNIFLGFSMKLGNVIEHPNNSGTMPMGKDPGFLERLLRSRKNQQGED